MTQTQSTPAILREAEFTPFVDAASQALGGWLRVCVERPEILDHSGSLVSLSDAAHALETFLDDHGARQNQTFVTFGELVASMRGLARVKSRLLHLRHRLPRYPTLQGSGDLPAELVKAARILDECLCSLASGLIEEAVSLGVEWRGALPAIPEPAVRPRQLPRNLGVDVAGDEHQHIAEIGGRLASVLEASRGLDLERVRPVAELASYAAERATEDRCRWYESAVHNIQSMYDTHVGGTSIEEREPWLTQVRGHASISFHLLEMATELAHFYERHENELRHESAKEAIASLVSKQRILDVAVNTCLRQAYLFIESGSTLIDQILTTFVSRRSETLALPDGVTLHARPLALIVQVARHYASPMEIIIGEERCSASSLMGLIMLAGKYPKARSLSVTGDARALSDLVTLFRSGLGEMGSAIPAELDYLKLRG